VPKRMLTWPILYAAQIFEGRVFFLIQPVFQGEYRVNTQAGPLRLAASRLFRTPVKAEGQDPIRKMDNGSPEVLESI
jgi:hypothetical protein